MKRVTVTVTVFDSELTKPNEKPIETSASMMFETDGRLVDSIITSMLNGSLLYSLYIKARQDLEA